MTTWSALAELTHPGDAIRERRMKLGWTQAELAKRSSVPQADISRIENRRLDARWSTIQRLCAALAARSATPRLSIANGGKVTETTVVTSKKWSPRGPTLAISSTHP